MILGFPTFLKKILACIPIDRYKKIGTICVNDTCLRILLAAARDLQSRGPGNSPAARLLHDDWQARNKQYNKNISKQSNKQRNFSMMMQWLDRFCRYETFGAKIT
jgi:hypothetical protein